MPITRRHFTTLAGAAFGAYLPAYAEPPRRIRVAMVGTGHGHAASKVKALNGLAAFEFVGACRPDDRDTPRGDIFESVQWLKIDRILSDPTVELIAIEGADPDWNLEYAWRCARAGKFIHLDKPPGSSLSSLRDIITEVESHERYVQMGYQWRYHPAMQASLEAARRGWLGDVYRFRASIDKPILADERRELARYKGGMLFSEGCHLIDRATDLLGEPSKVTGFKHHRSNTQDGLADNALAVLEYPNAIAEISMAGFDPNGNQHRYLEVLGTNGFARVQPYSPLRLIVDLKEAAGPYSKGEQILEPPNPAGYPYAADFKEFAAVIREGAKPAFSASHDLMTHRVLLEACGML